MVIAACGSGAAHRGRTVVYASGADLQSVNPLLTVHPFARQVERYVLLTTLVRYDSALVPRPYLARAWTWSEDRKSLTFRLQPGVRWGDDVLTDLAILPARLLDSIPRTELRRAAWNEHPVGNGPFRFVAHEAGRRWVFAANPDFPGVLGGPPALERFIVVVVDEPTTKLAALTSGEIDFAGIQPAHAAFVRKNPALTVLDYPQIMPNGIVFNTRNPPFDDARVRLAVALALDRREIVDGYLFGFGAVADGPVPPGVPGYAPVRPIPTNPDSARRLLGGRRIAFELLTVGSSRGPSSR